MAARTASGPARSAGRAVGTGRGRPQRPLDTTVPALAELAQELRELRATAGLKLDDLYTLTHWSKGALSAATTGRDLPRWDLVRAWVTACDPGANLDLWEARHARARAQYERSRLAPVPAEGGRTEPPHAPDVLDVLDVVDNPAVPAATAALADRADPAGPAGPRPSSLERDAWRTLAPDRRPWGVAAHPAAIPLRFTTVGPDFTDTGSDAADLTGRYDQIGEIFALTEQAAPADPRRPGQRQDPARPALGHPAADRGRRRWQPAPCPCSCHCAGGGPATARTASSTESPTRSPAAPPRTYGPCWAGTGCCPCWTTSTA